MPVCCIVQCGARKNKKHTQLSLHRFPKNEGLKKKWLEAIGESNINHRHKEWYLCSLHFEESCFNRTLDVIRLRDDSVPTVFPSPVISCTSTVMPPLQSRHRNVETVHKELPVISWTSTVMPPLQSPHRNVETVHKESPVISWTSTVMPPLQSPHRNVETVHKEVVKTENIKTLKVKCVKQQQTIKRLNERIRKQNQKIANLNALVEELRKKNCTSMEQAVVIEDLQGPKHVLKRRINKSKGLPAPNKHSEGIKKVALTLHFISPKTSI